MNASKFILLAGLFAIITAELIPAQNTPTPTAKVEPDPVKSFKELVARFPKRSIIKSIKTPYDIVNVTFDVKKTDSLMNPVIGTINFSTDAPPYGNSKRRIQWDVQMEFHWQGDHWKFGRLLDRENGHDITHTGMGEDILGVGPMADFLKSVQ